MSGKRTADAASLREGANARLWQDPGKLAVPGVLGKEALRRVQRDWHGAGDGVLF